jgi:hypothetical protein
MHFHNDDEDCCKNSSEIVCMSRRRKNSFDLKQWYEYLCVIKKGVITNLTIFSSISTTTMQCKFRKFPYCNVHSKLLHPGGDSNRGSWVLETETMAMPCRILVCILVSAKKFLTLVRTGRMSVHFLLTDRIYLLPLEPVCVGKLKSFQVKN